MSDAGLLLVVAAPSGAGKTSLVRRLLETDPAVRLSISHTTRPIRPGETDGEHYQFVARETFDAMVTAGEFVEYADVFGHLYGTAAQNIAVPLAAGQDLLLEIDWQGAEQVRERFPEALTVFVLPPSRATLNERLRRRGQDSPDVIERRTRQARADMTHYSNFDYLVVNDDFDVAAADLEAIVRAERLRQRQAGRRLAGLLAELLA
ncbi:MAG: guanylate kinase [Pseudomonadota bacterium]